MAPAPGIRISALDEQRFGVRTAKADVQSRADVDAVLKACRDRETGLLIVRCGTEHIHAAQALEQAGARLMDTLVYFRRDLRTAGGLPTTEQDTEATRAGNEGVVCIRAARLAEAEKVRSVAELAFDGYRGHYHADPRLAPDAVAAVYPDWAYRSCTGELADHVLVADLDGEVAGFATLRMNSADEGEGVLFAVAPHAHRRGIYRSFILGGLQWCKDQGADSMVVSTQVTNQAVQRVWARLGFLPAHSLYTFHLWFA